MTADLTANGAESAAATRAISPRIAIIEGSQGYCSLLAAYVRGEWPGARIEVIDPFSQTMRGAGISFGTDCEVMVLGGIGTRAEALSALSRLRANTPAASHQDATGAPPVIMLVGPDLAPAAHELQLAGAAAVLPKDALSRRSLLDAIANSANSANRANTASNASTASPAGRPPATPSPTADDFGKFAFRVDGEPVVLAIEHYGCVKTLAANPMSQVFLAESLVDRKRAVVKIPVANPYHDPALVQPFCDRFQFIHSLDGDGVVRYLDAGIAGSWPYVVLEYLAGGDLRKRMASGLTTDQALAIMARLAVALATFHGGQFAHMDLKPENIFFREDGELVLIDFNISTKFGGIARHRITRDVLGSPFYLSPEQGQGLPADGRSDLYSAGIILFEMLTGERPFTGDHAAQLIYKHIHEEIPLLPKRIRDLQTVIDHLLAKNPDERFGSAAALAIALRPFIARYAALRDGDAPAVKSAN